jgi:hypothetical protein
MEQRDRVRKNTAPEIDARIDAGIEASVREYAARDIPEITVRIAQLDLEWDVERVLETNATALALGGLAPGATRGRRWLFLLPFLLLHAVQGWCPPIEIIRRFGVRTRREIDLEKVALKALRGDFGLVAGGSTGHERAKLALSAASG